MASGGGEEQRGGQRSACPVGAPSWYTFCSSSISAVGIIFLVQSKDSVFLGEISSLRPNPALSSPHPQAPAPPATLESHFASSHQTLQILCPGKPLHALRGAVQVSRPVRPALHEPVARAVFFTCSSLQDGQTNAPRPGRDRALPAGGPSTGPLPQVHKPPSCWVLRVPGTGRQLSPAGSRQRRSWSSRSVCGAAAPLTEARQCGVRAAWVLAGPAAPGKHVARSGRGQANIGANARFLITASEREDVP